MSTTDKQHSKPIRNLEQIAEGLDIQSLLLGIEGEREREREKERDEDDQSDRFMYR